MSLCDPISNFKVVTMVPAGDYVDTAPTTGDLIAVDTEGWEWATICVQAGTLTGGTNWTFTVQESSDDGAVDTYADVQSTPGASTLITLGAGDDGEVHAVAIKTSGTERYLKLAIANTGTWTVSDMAVICVLSGPKDSAHVASTNIDGQFIAD
jgi:hypothetical protein